MDRISALHAAPAVGLTVDAAARDAFRRLIDACADGVEGHRKAAELVDDAVAKSLFELWANERTDFLVQLQNVAVRFGATEEDPGTATAAAHRGWMSLANVFGDDGAVIEAAATGEKAAVDSYEAALATDLPDYARPVVISQYEQVRAILERLENWETV